MSKEKRKREDDLDNERPPREEDNNGGENMPRFSFTWIYILIGLALLGLHLSKMFVTPPTISWDEFARMARAGDVEKLDIVNKETARAYIKKDSLCEYFTLFHIEDKNADCQPDKQSWGLKTEHSYVTFDIGTPEVLSDKLNTLNDSLRKEKKATISERYITETNWTGTIITYMIP